MRGLLASFLAMSLVTLLPSPALAEESRPTTNQPSVSSSPSVSLNLHPKKLWVEGKEGVWFEKQEASLILDRLTLLKDTQALLDDTEEVVTAADKRIAVLEERIKNADSRVASQKDRADLNEKLATKALDDLEDSTSWTRSPVLWMGVGIVGTVIIGVLLKTAIDAGGSFTIIK